MSRVGSNAKLRRALIAAAAALAALALAALRLGAPPGLAFLLIVLAMALLSIALSTWLELTGRSPEEAERERREEREAAKRLRW